MYSADEIQAAVQKLVRSAIRRPTDPLGVSRADVTFSDIQEAAAGVFLLYPDAPYYLVSLGARRLLDALSSEVALVRSLIAAIDAAGRRTMPIEDVSSLFNMKAALEELESASAARANGFKDITKVSAFQRFDSNVSAFLSGPAANIRVNGHVVETPEQARKAIPGMLAQLRAQHATLVASATGLATALDDYASVNLPALVARGVIGRSRQVLAEHAQALDGLTSDGRLERVRDVTLDVLASKAVVRALGSFNDPSSFLAVSGSGRAYSDATHIATPATITSDLANAYSVLAGQNALDVTLGVSPPLRIFLTPSIVASLEGAASEAPGAPAGFLIGDGTNPPAPQGSATPANNRIQIQVTTGASSVVYTAPLTVSPSFTSLTTADQIVANVNAALPSSVRARAVFFPLRYSGPLDIAASAGTQTTASVPGGQAADFGALGVVPGDMVSVTSGANQGMYSVLGVPTGGQLTLQRAAGMFVAQTSAPCEIGPPARRIRIACADPQTQVPAQTALAVVASDAITQSGATTLGFVSGLTSRCLRSTCQDVVDGLAVQTDAVAATATFLPSVDGAMGRANVLDPFQVTLSRFSGRGDAQFSGNVLTLSGAFANSPIRPGDALVLRSGPNPGLAGVVASVAANAITATMASAGMSAVGLSFDSGVQLAPSEYQTLRIATGPNKGDYLIDGPGRTPLDVRLKRVLPAPGQGISAQTFLASLGDKAVTFSASGAARAAQMRIAGAAAALFFSSPPVLAEATSSYVLLPQAPRGVAPDDLLELYATDYRTPSLVLPVQSVEMSLSVIRLSGEVPLSTAFNFGPGSPPFARVRFVRTFNFSSFRERLEAWLALPTAQASFFADLNRFINPLLVSSNPPAAVVGAARDRIATLSSVLAAGDATTRGADSRASLEAILSDYNVVPLGAVDTLLRTFTEKGSDRAVALLVQGRFSAFFGSTMDEASYAGAMQSAMREVARADVPVAKADRADAVQGRALSTATSPDFEFDQSDVEEA